MTSMPSTTLPAVRVAIDVAKLTHQVLLELPSGKRRVMRVANTRTEIERFVSMLVALAHSCEIALDIVDEANGRRLVTRVDDFSTRTRVQSSIAVN